MFAALPIKLGNFIKLLAKPSNLYLMATYELTVAVNFLHSFVQLNKIPLGLTDEFINHYTEWILALSQGSKNSKRFLISFAIDLKNNIISAEDWVGYLSNLDKLESVDKDHPEQLFEQIRHNKKLYSGFNRYPKMTAPLKLQEFASVMTIHNLNEIFLENNIPELSDTTINDLKTGYLDKILTSPISVVKKKDREVWVLPYVGLKAIINSTTDRVGKVCDYVGWQRSIESDDWKKNDYIYMIYPPTLQIETFIPSVFNKYWYSQDLYLSYPKNKAPFWGKTYNEVSGERNESVHERIHSPVLDKEYKFEVYYLGELTSTMPLTPKHTIIEEGILRFEDCKDDSC